jgi:hypothetical protein
MWDVGIQTAGDVLTRMITSEVNTLKCRRYAQMERSHVQHPCVRPASSRFNFGNYRADKCLNMGKYPSDGQLMDVPDLWIGCACK